MRHQLIFLSQCSTFHSFHDINYFSCILLIHIFAGFIQFPSTYLLFHRLCREISFQFRTRLPHGLLVYHNVKNPEGIELDPYALYVIVEKGQLKVVHVFGKHSTSVIVGEGLNKDVWHKVMVKIVVELMIEGDY